MQGASSALRASVSSSDTKQERNLAASSLDATTKKIRGGSEEKERQLRYFTHEGSSGGGGNNNNTAAPIVDEEDTPEQFTTLEDIVCSSSALSLDDQLSNLCQVFNETSRSRNEMDSAPTVMNPRIIGYSSSYNFDWNLKSGEAFTLFAPINSAFGAPPLETLLPPGLFKTQFLNTHIVNRAISPSELTRNCGFGVATRFVGETTTTLCDLQGLPLYQVGQGNTISDRPTLIGTALRVLNGQGYIYPIDNFIKPSQFLGSRTDRPTSRPIPRPTSRPNAPIGPMPTPMPVMTLPTPAPFDSSSLGGMSGIARPFPTIISAVNFNLELSLQTDLILQGGSLRRQLQTADEDFSGCRYQPRSDQIVASSPECTQYFPSGAGDFCYRFELFVGQQDPPNETLCPINAAIDKIIDAAKKGAYSGTSIGDIQDAKLVQYADTAAPSESSYPSSTPPTEGPTSDEEPTDAPTSGDDDDDEPTDAPTSGDDDDDEPTDAPTSD